MSNHKTKQRLMAMMLSAIMLLGMMPVSVSAEASTLPVGSSGEIIAFGALGTSIAVQDVPFGTPQTDLNLPDTLTATIRLTASKEAPILYSGETDLESDSAETISGSAVVMDETDGTENGGSEGAQIASPSEAEPAEDDGDNPEEVTVPLPVTWTSSPGYHSETAGTYLFTPTLPEGIALAGGVEVPTICVTVEAAAITGRVTAFDALPGDIRWQNSTEPVFPEEVSGTVDGEAVQIPVSWRTEQVYDEKSPANGLYVFYAVPDEGYTFAADVIAPLITVYVPEAASRFAPLRMGGGGTGASPLEITTATQLVEIAALVNAGRLESFLFNDNTATVYLEMKNDLDLSAYGMDWNGGKGWVPIGTATNPFKGHFNGNHNGIVGLYINDNTLDNAGLFGSIEDGMVQKLTLSDASVRGATETGGIAGCIKDATVKNCGVTGSVSGSAKVGGVAGVVLGKGKVEHCYSAGSVGGIGNQVGGIAGELTTITSTVQNCYSTAAVKGSESVGGIAGHVQISENNVQYCAALNPSVTAASTSEGRVAGYYSTEGSLSNNVAFSGMTGGGNDKSPSGLDGADITADEIKAKGSIGDRFTAAYGWTTAPGKLPGFDAATAMPAYIIDISGEYFNGVGTSESPYQISTPAQLAKLSELVRNEDDNTRNAYNTKHYKLTADIDLSVYNADNIGFNGGKGWIPIGGYFPSTLRAFSGVFDGGGYNIKGLYINSGSSSWVGLFGVINNNGTVKNLGVVDAYIRAGNIVGGIAAKMIGTMENCFITGVIVGTNFVGGMIGDINGSSSSIINCYSAAAVTGVDEVGGIVGRSNMGSVVNSYAAGTVTGTSKVGGIVGYFYGISGSKVQNCFALNPSISGSDEVSRVIGTHMNIGVISGNHAYSGMTVTVGGVVQTITDGTADNINGLAKTADELQGISGFPSGFDADPWTYTEKMLPGLRSKAVDMPLHLLPTGTNLFGGGDGASEAQAYEISTAAQLAKLSELVSSNDEATRNKYNSKYYKLTDHIDLSAYGKSYDGGKGWVPIGRVIGNRIRWFNGKFDGNGKVITGLYINRADEGSIGLFGYIYEANVKNIAVMGANVNGNNKVGGIAGMTSYATAQGCYVSGTISGERFIGGIVGAHAANTILQDCRNDASVRGNDDTIGGIVGWTSGVVKNCYATGSVSGSTKVGGIAGDITNGGNVRNCAALNPEITATGAVAGRVAGIKTGALTSNYAFSGMKVNGIIVTNGTAADINGLDMGIAQANAASFWTTGGNWNISAWNTSIWEITDNKLPVLTVFPPGTQSGDGGLYLIERDIANATVGSIDNFIYNGSYQIPTLTVIFDGAALVKDKDYTLAITSTDGTDTSTGTKVGEVTITLTGKGNYTGTISKNFTIEKRPVTIRANDKSMTRGGTLPTFTYTVDGQLSGETALAGVPALTCVADGKTAGSYPITIDLAGVSYTANYEAANPALVNGTLTVNHPPSSGSGGGSSFGSHTATTVPEKQPDQPVTAKISVTATVGQNGTSSANLSDKAITGAIAKAQEEAKAQGKTANGISIALNVNLPQGASSLSLPLSQNALQSLVNAGVRSFTINGTIASLSLDLEALKEIQKQSAGSLTITIKPVQNLSSGARAMIGTRPVHDVTVIYSKDGKTVNITSLGEGSATLSIPYAPGRHEAVGYLFGVYVDANGKATRIDGSAYDANSGSIILGSNHFSVYGVGYTAPSAKFTDINSHWGKEAIDYVVGRGLLSGTTDTTFSPNMAMDRGMLVTVLGRLSGADVSAYKTSSFTDVAVGKYYLPYIEWAYKKGVVSGIGNGKFAPDQAITREEIAVIYANYAKATGYILPVTLTAAVFEDASSIGGVYKTAVIAMQQAGIMMGGTNNKLYPKANANRAEVSSMLHRYIKLTIDPATAQGWVLNDSGQHLYYKDGKPLTGTQTIDDAKYFFNTDGTLKTGWVKDGGNWRFCDGNKLLIGWWNIGSDSSKQTYYFDTYGNMISGKWLQIDGKWYYFNADGSLAKNTRVDGYEVDENGVRKSK